VQKPPLAVLASHRQQSRGHDDWLSIIGGGWKQKKKEINFEGMNVSPGQQPVDVWQMKARPHHNSSRALGACVNQNQQKGWR